MNDPTPSPDESRDMCWQCGAPTLGARGVRLRLVAPSRRKLDALGCETRRRKRQDEVQLVIPRCRACRNRNFTAVLGIFAGCVAGALLAPFVAWLAWRAPSGAAAGAGGQTADFARAVGIIAGAAAAMLAIVLLRRRRGLRSIGRHPTLLALRRLGWRYPGG